MYMHSHFIWYSILDLMHEVRSNTWYSTSCNLNSLPRSFYSCFTGHPCNEMGQDIPSPVSMIYFIVSTWVMQLTAHCVSDIYFWTLWRAWSMHQVESPPTPLQTMHNLHPHILLRQVQIGICNWRVQHSASSESPFQQRKFYTLRIM